MPDSQEEEINFARVRCKKVILFHHFEVNPQHNNPNMSDEEVEVKTSDEEEAVESPKKGRGRPKKGGEPASAEKRKASPAKKDDAEPKAKRGRGRPPKKGAKKPVAPPSGRGRGRPKAS